jgi:hypothetical protein
LSKFETSFFFIFHRPKLYLPQGLFILLMKYFFIFLRPKLYLPQGLFILLMKYFFCVFFFSIPHHHFLGFGQIFRTSHLAHWNILTCLLFSRFFCMFQFWHATWIIILQVLYLLFVFYILSFHTASAPTLFHHWSICVRHEFLPSKTKSLVTYRRQDHLSLPFPTHGLYLAYGFSSSLRQILLVTYSPLPMSPWLCKP